MSETLHIPAENFSISGRWNKADNAHSLMILAHGAGAGMDHVFMEKLAVSLSHVGITVLRFNFPYIDQGRRAPDSPKKAQKAIVDVVNFVASEEINLPVLIGGKSYGGRMASHCAAHHEIPSVKGLVYYGFPLHAPGRDSKDRADHLSEVEIPMLFLQGSNDKLANFELITEVAQSLPQAELEKFESADHSFKMPKKMGLDQDQVIGMLAEKTLTWVKKSIV